MTKESPGISAPGQVGYEHAHVNTDPGDAEEDVAKKAAAVAEGELEDPAVANAKPERVEDGEVTPPPA